MGCRACGRVQRTSGAAQAQAMCSLPGRQAACRTGSVSQAAPHKVTVLLCNGGQAGRRVAVSRWGVRGAGGSRAQRDMAAPPCCHIQLQLQLGPPSCTTAHPWSSLPPQPPAAPGAAGWEVQAGGAADCTQHRSLQALHPQRFSMRVCMASNALQLTTKCGSTHLAKQLIHLRLEPPLVVQELLHQRHIEPGQLPARVGACEGGGRQAGRRRASRCHAALLPGSGGAAAAAPHCVGRGGLGEHPATAAACRDLQLPLQLPHTPPHAHVSEGCVSFEPQALLRFASVGCVPVSTTNRASGEGKRENAGLAREGWACACTRPLVCLRQI